MLPAASTVVPESSTKRTMLDFVMRYVLTVIKCRLMCELVAKVRSMMQSRISWS